MALKWWGLLLRSNQKFLVGPEVMEVVVGLYSRLPKMEWSGVGEVVFGM